MSIDVDFSPIANTKLIKPSGLSAAILDVLPRPVLCLDAENKVIDANSAAEEFFEIGKPLITQYKLIDLLDFDSPVTALIAMVRKTRSPIYEHQIEIRSPRIEGAISTDIYVADLDDVEGNLVLMLQPRTIADKINKHMHQRGAARSMISMASILAHEIKNPLFGIRGAAQLLESTASSEDKSLLSMIKDETDRIARLVERMEIFNSQRPVKQEPVNIYSVLDRVVQNATLGFAKHVKIKETYDPSLPAIVGDNDLLIQLFMNLVKNAAEAIPETRTDGQIEIRTAFRPGIKFLMPASQERVSLPLEISIIDNGEGFLTSVSDTLFDPFVTTKSNGTGLGLALVSKIVDDHGGIIECNRIDNYTKFVVLMPMFVETKQII